ncbi:sulfotransferase family protein [Methylomonas sp. MgM2]
MINLNPPIFIVGAPRSGTTLLQYMLKSHPEISLPSGESHFFIPFYQRRAEFGDLKIKANLSSLLSEIYQAKRDFFDDDFHGIKFDIEKLAEQIHNNKISTVPGVISALFQLNAQAEGKTYWGEKTPYYILHLNTIMEMFPTARIVHIIRDGRDCGLSMLARRWDLRVFNIYHAAYIWNKYVNSGIDFGKNNPNIYFELKYESLLSSPQTVFQELCRFLNIEYSESLINFKKSSETGKTPLLTQPLNRENRQKWKRRMSPKQTKIFEAIAGPTLSRCGYEVSNLPHKLSKPDWFVNEAHIRLCYFYCKYFLN